MARRHALRTSFRLEQLESREVLTAGGPTAEMQELLELTNFARQNPAEAANWATADLQTDSLGLTLKTFGVDVNAAKADIANHAPAQPLAWSDSLASAADTLSRYQAESGQQTHTGSGGTLADGTRVGVTMQDRLSNAGYGALVAGGENAFAYAKSARNATEAFLLDWGNDRKVLPHLTNLMNPAVAEVGFGIVNTSNKGLGPQVITEDFGARANAKAMLVGVAYNDTVAPDGMYTAGEGVGDVSIDVTDASGHTQTVQTWDAGGYQLPLDPGHYTVTARVGDKVVRSQGIDIGTQNVKVDFVLSQPWSGVVIAPPQTPKPAPTPAPAPAPIQVAAETLAPTPTPVATPSPTPTPAPVPVATPAPSVVATPTATPETPKAEVATTQVATFLVADPVATAQPVQPTPVVAPVVPAAANVLATPGSADPLNSRDLFWQSW